MLAFIDESGHPHPKDSNQWSVVVACCFSESDSRRIARTLHALKRDVLQRERMEMKGVRLLNRSVFRNRPERVAFVEEFFSTLLNLPVVIFSIIVERPSAPALGDETFLPLYFQYLVERIQLLAEEEDEMATLLFDGNGENFGGLSTKFNSFLYRSNQGQLYTRITDAPFFVDSKITAGIQIADMVASVIRQHQQEELYKSMPVGDHYLLAIRRYYRIIEQKTVSLTTPEGEDRLGIYRLSREHY